MDLAAAATGHSAASHPELARARALAAAGEDTQLAVQDTL